LAKGFELYGGESVEGGSFRNICRIRWFQKFWAGEVIDGNLSKWMIWHDRSVV